MKVKLDLGKDSIFTIFINYAIPSVLAMLAMSTAGIIDGIFIGRYVGTNALAAVNLVYPVAALALGISIMIGVGGSTVATTEMGAGNKEEASNTFTVTLFLVTAFALFVTFAGSFFIDEVVGLLGADIQVKADVKEYLSAIIYFFLFFMLTFILDAFIRSDGSPVFSVLALILSSLINIVLDYIFVARLAYGLTGAALATGISQAAAFLLLAGSMVIGGSKYRIVLPRFTASKIGKMLFNGSSQLVNEMSAGISTYVFNIVLMNRLGATGVAAYSIIGYGAMIANMFFFGIAQAIQPAVSYNLGKGDQNRISKFLRTAITVNIISGFLLFLAMRLFSEGLAGFFTSGDDELTALVVEISRYFSFAFLLAGINIVLSMYFTAMQKAADAVLTALSRSIIALMTGLYLLPLIFGTKGIWLTVLFAESVTLALSLILFRRHPRLKLDSGSKEPLPEDLYSQRTG